METKKQKIISIVATVGVILTLIGATYVYFQAQVGERKSTDVNINASTVDVFTFATGDGVTLTLDQDNFAEGTGNQTATTYASATLSANNKTNTATEHYYLYLNITSNNFTYSKDNTYPEILVKITDTNGTELVDGDIEGLTHKTVVDANGDTVTGFDITNKTGIITILDNRELTTTSTKEEKYTFTFVYVNYNFDQSLNAGKSFSAKVLIQKKKKTIPTLANWVKEEYAVQTSGSETIYYHDENLENGAGDNSYRYSGGDYELTQKTINEGFTKIQATDSSSTNALINLYCDGEKCYNYLLCANYENAYYTLQYDVNTVQYSTYKEIIVQAINDGYIVGENVNNYVCFGTDEKTCPHDNLYRIIGVFDDRVRLIKADYVTSEMLGTNTDDYSSRYYNEIYSNVSYYQGTLDLSLIPLYFWNKTNYSVSYTETNYYNDWSYSELNKTHLNKNYISYLDNIDTKWANMIDNTTWKVGGYEIEGNAKTSYKNEITSPSTQVTSTYESKIGLMYISDYLYAASSSTWNEYNKMLENNWMYMGLYEHSITRITYADWSYGISPNGLVSGFSNVEVYEAAVRPVFYLKNNIEVTGGDGTINNPIRIKG